MNSWISRLLAAWAPPLITFIMGIGRITGVYPAQVAKQGQAEGVGRRPGRGHGDAQDGIGAQLGLVGRAVQGQHAGV